jgi:hypothetical protein
MQQYNKASTSPSAIRDFDSIWEDEEFVKAAMCAANRAEVLGNIIESAASFPAKVEEIDDGFVKVAIIGCKNLVEASIERESASLVVWQLPKMDDDEDEDEDYEEDDDGVFLSALVEK